MKTRYCTRDYEGDSPCIHPLALAMAELLIRINNKTPRYKGLGFIPKGDITPTVFHPFAPYLPPKHN